MAELLGTFEQMCLMALVRIGPSTHGRLLWEEIEKRTARTVPVTQVYVTMERLERKGFVTSVLGEATPTRGGKPKKHFTITATGESALNESWGALDAMGAGLLNPAVPQWE